MEKNINLFHQMRIHYHMFQIDIFLQTKNLLPEPKKYFLNFK